MYFSKRKWKYFDTFNHYFSEKYSKRANSSNHPVWPLICRNKPAINPKWFNSLDTNSTQHSQFESGELVKIIKKSDLSLCQKSRDCRNKCFETRMYREQKEHSPTNWWFLLGYRVSSKVVRFSMKLITT